MKQLVVFFIMFSCSTMAASLEAVDIVSVYASTLVSVRGDEAEIDLNDNDDFTYLTLDASRVKGVRWAHIVPLDTSAGAGRQRFPFYVEYSTIDVQSDNDDDHSDKYQSLTFGYALQGVVSTQSRLIDTYFGIFAGGGMARFDFDEPEYEAVGEIAAEYGLILGNRFSAGIGVKRQIIGYPGETMAEVWHVNLTGSIWF